MTPSSRDGCEPRLLGCTHVESRRRDRRSSARQPPRGHSMHQYGAVGGCRTLGCSPTGTILRYIAPRSTLGAAPCRHSSTSTIPCRSTDPTLHDAAHHFVGGR